MNDHRRRGRVVGVAAVVATVTALALASCSVLPGGRSGSEASDSDAVYSMTVDCPAAPKPGTLTPTVEQLNSVVAQANVPYWQSGDIGASAELSDGRFVWIFGDTLRKQGIGPGMVANSMLVTSGLCLSQLMSAGKGPVIPDVKPGIVRWPMSVTVVQDQGTEVIVIFTARIQRSQGTDVWDFRYLGSDAVTFTVEPGGAPQLDEILPLTPDRDDPQQVNWGAASMVADHHIYVYGTELPKGAAYGRALLVGRSNLSNPKDKRTWEFWDGSAWQPDHLKATPVIAAQGGVSQTLSVDEVAGKVIAVSKQDGDLGSTVATWTGTSPVGPFTRSAALDAPFLTGDDEFAYAPLAHPEIELRSGKLLVSISRNTTDLARLRRDPVIGRPRFAEIDRP